MLLYNVPQIKKLEKLYVEKGYGTLEDLMNKAGKEAYLIIIKYYPKVRNILIICGQGGNGGDGYALARYAKKNGLKVTLYRYGIPKDHSLTFTMFKLAEKDNIPIFDYHSRLSLNFDIIIDAILGIGPYKRKKNNSLLLIINKINNSGLPILSLDIPSGIDPNSGSVFNQAIYAQITITFIAKKRGLFTGEALNYAGKVILTTLGVPITLLNLLTNKEKTSLLDNNIISKLLIKRKKNSHKGDYGHVLLIGGNYGMSGSIYMAAESALRVGAGLVTILHKKEDTNCIFHSVRPEIIVRFIKNYTNLYSILVSIDVIVIGPGLGTTSWSYNILKYILTHSNHPKIIDADGLNLLSKKNIL